MRSAPCRTKLRAALVQTLVWLLIAPPGWANPSGADVVAGDAEIAVEGRDTTIHAADNTIIDWQDFDIGVDESVRFIQPHELARVLNRVVTPDPTQIDGSLLANGIVYILNPYGIYFGDTALVDVGQLIAAAGNLSNEDFLAGIDRFTELGGSVENWGEIHAGSVGLFGASVANHGLISAPDGAIWLVAGDEVLVAQHGSPVVVRIGVPEADAAAPVGYAVENTGVLEAARGSVRMAAGDLLSLAVRNQGTIRAAEIELEGGAEGRVQVEGTLDATSADGIGGSVEIRGDLVALQGATVDASGSEGGGRVQIGGGWQGAREAGERNARTTWVGETSVVRADALESGDGGEVVVWSDDRAFVYGQLSARGGETGGNGGRVETSGKRWIDVRAAPDVSAPAGGGGLWLLDPSNLTIVDSMDPDLPDPINPPPDGDPRNLDQEVAETTDNNRISPTDDDSFISVQTIAEALGGGVTVFLSTQNAVGNNEGEEGNITWRPSADFEMALAEIDSTIQAGTTATLRLRAANDIKIGDVGVGQSVDLSDAASKLDLSVDFVAGDTSQPAPVTDMPIVDPGTLEVHGNIDVDGSVILAGNEVKLFGDVGATRSGADPNAETSTDFEIIIQSAERGIEADSIRAGAGNVTIFSSNDDLDEANADVVIDGDITVSNGGVAINATAGDVTVNGDIAVCDDCSLTGAEGASVVDIDSSILVDAPDAPTEFRHGTVTLNGSVTAGTGAVDVIARRITTNGAITTQSGNVLMSGIAFEIGEPDAVPRAGEATPGVDLNGMVTTNGGRALLGNQGVVNINANVDATGGDGTGLVEIDGTDDVVIGDVEILAGVSVVLEAGTDGSGNLEFAGVAPRVEADIVRLRAGDGYTPGETEANPLSEIVFGGAQFEAAGPAFLTELEILQDGSIDAGELPDAANIDLDPMGMGATELRIGSRDGSFTVDSGAAALINGVVSASLEAARESATGEALELQDTLSLSQLDVTIAEDFVLDQANFADHVNGSVTNLTVTTGTRAQAMVAAEGGNPQIDEVFGDLDVLADLTGFAELTLHGASAGRGDLTIGDAVTPTAANVSATRLTLRAGDGVGGVGTSAVIVDNGTLIADDFTLRQDGSIGGASGAAIPIVTPLGVPAPARYELRSDDGNITLEEADRSKLENRALVLASRALTTPAEFDSTPLDVHSLDVGGIGAFTVSNSVLDAFALTAPVGERSLTVRGGIGLNGNLTIAGGTLFEGDTIRLVASDGPGGIVGNAITGAAFSSVQYRKPGSSEAPDTFIFEQDAPLGQSTIPGQDQFRETDTDMLPTTVGIRAQGGTEISDLTTLPIDPNDPTSKLVLAGEFVLVNDSDGIRFVVPTEFRADDVELRAEGDGAFVDPNGQTIRYAAHATDEGEVDAGDLDPLAAGEGVPDQVVVRQDADLDGSNLADDPFGTRIDAAESKTRYELVSVSGDLRLGLDANDNPAPADRDKVRGTNLVLGASTGEDLTGTIDLSTPTSPDPMNLTEAFQLESLTIAQPRALDLSHSFEVEAQEAIFISAGTEGGADQDLAFASGTHLKANQIFLRAGEPLGLILELDPSELAVLDLSGITVELTGSDGLLELRQDGSFDPDGPMGPMTSALPTFVLDPTMVDIATIESRRGDLTFDLAELELGQLVRLQAGNLRPEDSEVGGLLTLELEPTSIEDSLPAVQELELSAPNIELKAPADGTSRVLARANPDPTDPFTVRFRAGFAGIESVTFEQDGQFVVGPDIASSELVQVDQFADVDPRTVEYVLRSRRTGDFTVDANFADQLAIFDVSVETGVAPQMGDAPGSVTITAETPGPGSTNTGPVFTGFSATADDIIFDTVRFDTNRSQRYQGTTTLMQTTTLAAGALGDITFVGTVDGADPLNPQSLTVQAGRNIQFGGDVGMRFGPAPAPPSLQNLTVQLAGAQATVEFGSEGDTSDSNVQVQQDLIIQSIDEDAYLADRTASPLSERSPALDRASILKRGNLHVDATNVTVGAGEKWTALGTLDIDATGIVQVGDLTADRIEIGGDPMSGGTPVDEIVVLRRARSNVLRADGGVDSDAGVDWVANEFELYAGNGVRVAGAGPNPVVGTPDGQRIGVNTSQGFQELPFSSAAIYPDNRQITSADLQYDAPNDELGLLVLDARPTGSPSTDFSRVLTPAVVPPTTDAPTQSPPSDELVFREVGIEARELSGRERTSRERGAGMLDDASRAWRSGDGVIRVAAPRLDGERAAEASALFDELFGPDMENAESIRATLGRSVADYRDHTGARRVLGFELRRFVRNRPSTQFEGYQVLEKLDRLFSAHRRSGLVPGEYRPVQRAWVEAITPVGIDAAELAQAIHPSRYVRGSDVLDVFGD
jgi:filamentous hemagglutinin family protein